MRARRVIPPNLVVAIVLLLSAFGCRSSFSEMPARDMRDYQSILEWTHKNGMPGAILLVRTPKETFLSSVGWADLKKRVPMRPDHSFRIASIAKMFSGTVTAQMVVEGSLDADAPITQYLPPAITDHVAYSDQITIRQLACHRSGIYDFLDNPWFSLRFLLNPRAEWPPSRFLRYAYDKPARFRPGQDYRYSNTNYLLLGMIVDGISESGYVGEVRRRILDPLALKHTYFELREPPCGDRAHGYEKLLGFQRDVTGWTPGTGGYGGMVSTVSDLAVAVRAIIGDSTLLDDQTRTLLQIRPGTGPADNSRGQVLVYNFGIVGERAADPEAPVEVGPWFFGHSGVTPGYLSIALHNPTDDITIVYFGSSTLLRGPFSLRRHAAFSSLLQKALFELSVERARDGSRGPAACRAEGGDGQNRGW